MDQHPHTTCPLFGRHHFRNLSNEIGHRELRSPPSQQPCCHGTSRRRGEFGPRPQLFIRTKRVHASSRRLAA
ncbi:hypothetical protein HMPREF0063_11020 [Aeromicrobium marinum DSM 15272]|uniref:Uncharacterized protein n=1 Tax=Aeromicrobium marinum DSM 15272 TaxID=585531 RepID=E2S934_9ACTN|nr:hypothetical protein HMPREF0063_11020 [Aeromicrobium marinum DSM 15272]